MERIKAKTAHDEHIIEFRALVDKKISEAIPEIKKQCMEECRRELGITESETKKDIELQFSVGNVRKQIMDALRKAFK